MCAFSDFGFARFRFSNARSKPMFQTRVFFLVFFERAFFFVFQTRVFFSFFSNARFLFVFSERAFFSPFFPNARFFFSFFKRALENALKTRTRVRNLWKKRKKKKVLLSGSDPFYLSKKLRRRRYGEVSAQTSQKSQNRALVKKKVAYRAPAAQACTPPTWTINRIFSKSEILAESLHKKSFQKKKVEEEGGKNQVSREGIGSF